MKFALVTLCIMLIGSSMSASYSLKNCKNDPGKLVTIHSSNLSGAIKANSTIKITGDVTYHQNVFVASSDFKVYFGIFKILVSSGNEAVGIDAKIGPDVLEMELALPGNLAKGKYLSRMNFLDNSGNVLQCFELNFTAQ